MKAAEILAAGLGVEDDKFVRLTRIK